MVPVAAAGRVSELTARLPFARPLNDFRSALMPTDDGGTGFARMVLEAVCGKLVRARDDLREWEEEMGDSGCMGWLGAHEQCPSWGADEGGCSSDEVLSFRA